MVSKDQLPAHIRTQIVQMVPNADLDNLIDLKQAELMIDWCADVLDTGALGTAESSMAKVAVSALPVPPLRPAPAIHILNAEGL